MGDKKRIIAIDGPAGSGKSTVARLIAKRLDLLYIDTGAMYRALTLKAMEKGLDLHDKGGLIEMASQTDVALKQKGNKLSVLLDGKEVSDKIRTPELTNNVKFIARVGGVRKHMVILQRRMAEKDGAVLEGRDIGTVVFPHADFKFYLDADFKERVSRRYKELVEAGADITEEAIEEDVRTRDKSDQSRKVAPLKMAEDAVPVDTTNTTIEEVVEKIVGAVQKTY